MTDGKPSNEGDGKGTEPDTSTEDNKKDPTEFQKLKASNDEFEKELIRGRELKAESQKLEAEKMLGGTSGGRVEPVVKEVSDVDYAKSVMAGEVPDVKEA